MNDDIKKPFRILGVQQIAIGGADKARLRALWVDVLGLSVKGSFVSRARERRRGHLRARQRAVARSRST